MTLTPYDDLTRGLTPFEQLDPISQAFERWRSEQLTFAQALALPEVVAMEKRIAELVAKLAIATEALQECEADLDGYISQEYHGDHPAMVHRRNRDLDANPARIALAKLKGRAE